MADLTVRGQCRRAMSLLSADRAAEAVAVCRRVLGSFPKHIGTYSVLAQAYLVLGDLEEAASLLRRVLSADPEHAGSQVGLGMICEEQGQLDQALWHMQRAFEISPGSPEVRRELRRMYEERGMSPVGGLKFSRAALARTYLRGGLYSRAIRELHELLDVERDRLDLRVALAQALWLGKLYEDAGIVCQALLAELPDCLKANLILGQVWLNTDRDDQARALLQRAQAIEPENTTAQALLGALSPLPPRVARLPLAGESAPAPDLAPPEEKGLPSEADLATEEEAAGPNQGMAYGEPRIQSGEVPSPPPPPTAQPETPADLDGEPSAAPGTSLAAPEVGEASLLAVKDAEAATARARELQEETHRAVKRLAASIDWEGMSLIDVRRHYVEDHPHDHEARLDLARRYRNALDLEGALKHYTALVEQDYHALDRVIHDLELLDRLYPLTPALESLLAAAREKGHIKPSD